MTSKTAIILRLLLIFGYGSGVMTAAAADDGDMRSYLEANGLADLTLGLTDQEIEQALGDLTLSDLNVLSKLVDTPALAEYDYEDDGYSMHNMKDDKHKFEDAEVAVAGLDEADEQLDDDIYVEQPPAADEGLQAALSAESVRWKRENTPSRTQIAVDEDYIKQLENSFPRDQDQSNQEAMDVKKEHVRIKRD